MSHNASELRLSNRDSLAIGREWRNCESQLPDGWVVAGVLMRAGIQFATDDESELFVAVAVKLDNWALGPVPEIRGGGATAADAMRALARQVSATDFT